MFPGNNVNDPNDVMLSAIIVLRSQQLKHQWASWGWQQTIRRDYSPAMGQSTSFRCRWQTRATRRHSPTVLYTDVAGQCNKLVTDDCRQFIALTVHRSWQHLGRSTWQLYLQPFQWWLVPTKLKWFT